MTTLLLDADIVAYKIASINQESLSFGTGHEAIIVDQAQAIQDVDELIANYRADLGASDVIVCLSDPKENFRKELTPTYKANRKNTVKPQLLGVLKEYLADEYKSFIRPRLEADDIMGILQTSGDRFIKGERIIVSEDKDMRTIPGLVYNPGKPEVGVLDISELDADRFHMWQTIVGDPTDGYPGCPGLGEGGRYVDYAKDLLGADREELWDIVLMAYASKGLTEDDAVLQARLAHILRAESYNFKTKKVRLWQPFWLA